MYRDDTLSADRYTVLEEDEPHRHSFTLGGFCGDCITKLPTETDCPECGEPLTVGDGDEPVHVFCDLCGKAEHPADMTTDWNGETGNHRSCETKVSLA